MELTSLLMYILNAPTWTARKLDKRVTAEAKAANSVAEGTDAGNFNKLILPECSTLKAVAAWIGATRAGFYLHTAPWGEQRGVRVGKAEEHMDLMLWFGDRKAGLVPLLDAFGVEYPSKVSEMEYLLNGMFNAADYPMWEDVRSKFALRLSVQPLPNATDVRVLTEIPQHVREEIEESIREEQGKVYAQSIRHVLEQLLLPIHHMATQLKGYDEGVVKKVYASLVSNVGTMATAARKLNIARDPELDALAGEADMLVAGLTQEDLKGSDGTRAIARGKAEALAARIAALML